MVIYLEDSEIIRTFAAATGSLKVIKKGTG